MKKIPWTDDEIKSLNAYQYGAWTHRFTCGNNICRHEHDGWPLLAATNGWYCQFCDYTQDWCHEFMADWSWKQGQSPERETI